MSLWLPVFHLKHSNSQPFSIIIVSFLKVLFSLLRLRFLLAQWEMGGTCQPTTPALKEPWPHSESYSPWISQGTFPIIICIIAPGDHTVYYFSKKMSAIIIKNIIKLSCLQHIVKIFLYYYHLVLESSNNTNIFFEISKVFILFCYDSDQLYCV